MGEKLQRKPRGKIERENREGIVRENEKKNREAQLQGKKYREKREN